MELYDNVALLNDIPEKGLQRGQVGTIVEIWQPGVFEIEFSDSHGAAYATIALSADQLMRLHWQPMKAES